MVSKIAFLTPVPFLNELSFLSLDGCITSSLRISSALSFGVEERLESCACWGPWKMCWDEKDEVPNGTANLESNIMNGFVNAHELWNINENVVTTRKRGIKARVMLVSVVNASAAVA